MIKLHLTLSKSTLQSFETRIKVLLNSLIRSLFTLKSCTYLEGAQGSLTFRLDNIQVSEAPTFMVCSSIPAVQNERQPRNSAQVRQEQLEVGLDHTITGSAATVSATHPAFVPAPHGHSPAGHPPPGPGHSFRPPALGNTMDNPVKDMDERGKSILMLLFPKSWNHSLCHPSAGNEDNIDVTSLEYDRPLVPAYPEGAIYPTGQETVYECSARLLFMAVKWSKSLPSFANLPFRDQVILLEEAWSELFLLCAIQWSMPMESSPLLSTSEHAQNAPNGKATITLTDIRILQEIFGRFRVAQVDPAEFACLKAIVLFKPGQSCFKSVHSELFKSSSMM